MKKTLSLAVLVIILIGIGVYALHTVAAKTSASHPASSLGVASFYKNLPATLATQYAVPFHYQKKYGYLGSLTLKGFVSIVDPPECKPTQEKPCVERPSYVFFNIYDADNNLIFDFINTYKETPFVAKRAVGLGCYDKATGRVYSDNPGDAGTYSNLLTGKSAKQLLESTGKKQVNLRITKAIFTGEEKPHLCYSYFREFKVTPVAAKPSTTTSAQVSTTTAPVTTSTQH